MIVVKSTELDYLELRIRLCIKGKEGFGGKAARVMLKLCDALRAASTELGENPCTALSDANGVLQITEWEAADAV